VKLQLQDREAEAALNSESRASPLARTNATVAKCHARCRVLPSVRPCVPILPKRLLRVNRHNPLFKPRGRVLDQSNRAAEVDDVDRELSNERARSEKLVGDVMAV
jgi:hypothetical protein